MKKTIYKIEFFMLLITILLIFIANNLYKNIIAIIGMVILLFVVLLLCGRKKDNDFYKWSAFRIIIVVLLSYFIIISLLGLVLGFNKTLFSLNILNWFNGLIPTLILTLLIEYLRYTLIKKNVGNNLAIYILTAIIILFNIIININSATLSGSYEIFAFICTVVFPIIANDILGSYTAYNYGYLPTVTYRLAINLYLYLIPITTNLNAYLYGIINVVIPFTIYILFYNYLNIVDKQKNNKKNEAKINLGFITVPLTITLFVIVVLVSGIFKYQMIAIASNSMIPVFERGDALIFEKVDKNVIKIGDIIVFKNDNKIISHRVIKIKENSDKRYFYTKGDANLSNDENSTTEDEVLGVVKLVTKYIGYPTVWINELFGGEIYKNQ